MARVFQQKGGLFKRYIVLKIDTTGNANANRLSGSETIVRPGWTTEEHIWEQQNNQAPIII